jgi:hypothetical protein
MLLDGAVEADESFFGKRKFGHQTIVAGVRQRGGSVRLGMLEDRSGPRLTTFLIARVLKRALLLTDDHDGYLAAEAAGFAREVCVHDKGEFSLTAGIENIWSRCKCQMRRQYGRFLPFYLRGWLKEWEARVNRPELFISPETYLSYCLVPC